MLTRGMKHFHENKLFVMVFSLFNSRLYKVFWSSVWAIYCGWIMAMGSRGIKIFFLGIVRTLVSVCGVFASDWNFVRQ